ncbi:nucleotidyltransferase family protein [Frondihabitans cladoniiphilus]|uniref:NTP transferase domain-containing protein n=1 Tax=Frondihabitans cladoniiphilus TaxID=715785 RepID=A0ABP8WBA4_9MICO
MILAGLVLAAGAGSRYGRPKALVRDAGGVPWVASAVALLESVGCTQVTVVLGASAVEARELVPADAHVVEAVDWHSGMAASLRAGLAAVASAEPAADAVLLTLVDLPGLPAAVGARVVGSGTLESAAQGVSGPGVPAGLRSALRQAVFEGRPGHPTLIGRNHWPALVASLTGDRGARPYLVAHGAVEVECGDLWHGADVDVSPG